MTKIDSNNQLKTISTNTNFQYFPRENLDLEAPGVDISIQKSKNGMETSPTKNEYTQVPKSNEIPYTTFSIPPCCSHGPPAWSRGAKMASRGAPEVPKSPAVVLPRWENGSPKS